MRFAGMTALMAAALLAGSAAAEDKTEFARGGAFPTEPQQTTSPSGSPQPDMPDVPGTNEPDKAVPAPDTRAGAAGDTPRPELPEGRANGFELGGAGGFNLPAGPNRGRPMPGDEG